MATRAAFVLLLSGACAGLRMQLGGSSKTKLLVIGGNGFVGREVCKYAVQNGFEVTSLSRRGQCPDPNDEDLSEVNWQAGNALDKSTVNKYVNDADAVVRSPSPAVGFMPSARAARRGIADGWLCEQVHAIGLLFDVDSGLQQLNMFTSFSKSEPDEDST